MTPDHAEEFEAWRAEQKAKRDAKRAEEASIDAKKEEAEVKKANVIRLRAIHAQEKAQLAWNQQQQRYTMRERQNMEKLILLQQGKMPQEPDMEPYNAEVAPF